MAKYLYTVGYESREIEEFVEALRGWKIRVVADVRKNPVSRKPGFSKSRLAKALENAGIEYLHFPKLGVPGEWRKQAKAGLISRAEMFRDYRQKILPLAMDDIRFLKSQMQKTKTALLCYETDADDCHRRYVARKVTTPAHIRNLVVKEKRR